MQIFRPEDLRKRPSIKDIPDLTPKPIPPSVQIKTTMPDIAWIINKLKELETRIDRIEKEMKLR